MRGLGLFNFFAKKVPSYSTTPLGTVKKENFVHVSDTQVKMGTFVNLQCLAESGQLAKETIARVFLRIDTLEQIFSRHDSASLLSVLNSQGSIADFPKEFKCVLVQARAVENQTCGAFNPSVLSVLKYLETNSHITAKEFHENFSRIIKNPVQISERNIQLKQSDSIITLDAIAKGYIVDQAAAFFEKQGIHDYLINAGGDIRVKGMKSYQKGQEKTWRIAIEDPYKQGNYPAVFSLMRGALATSGSYEKNFGNERNHIILPSLEETEKRTGAHNLFVSGSFEHISPTVKSVSVVAPTAMQADAYATAISCMPVQNAIDYINKNTQLACMIIAEDDRIVYSRNWKLR